MSECAIIVIPGFGSVLFVLKLNQVITHDILLLVYERGESPSPSCVPRPGRSGPQTTSPVTALARPSNIKATENPQGGCTLAPINGPTIYFSALRLGNSDPSRLGLFSLG